jgi:hypothetical protein
MGRGWEIGCGDFDLFARSSSLMNFWIGHRLVRPKLYWRYFTLFLAFCIADFVFCVKKSTKSPAKSRNKSMWVSKSPEFMLISDLKAHF